MPCAPPQTNGEIAIEISKPLGHDLKPIYWSKWSEHETRYPTPPLSTDAGMGKPEQHEPPVGSSNNAEVIDSNDRATRPFRVFKMTSQFKA